MGEVIAMCWKDVLKKDGCGCMTRKQDEGEEFEKRPERKKIKCPKCKGKGCGHCKGIGYHKSKKRSAFTAGD